MMLIESTRWWRHWNNGGSIISDDQLGDDHDGHAVGLTGILTVSHRRPTDGSSFAGDLEAATRVTTHGNMVSPSDGEHWGMHDGNMMAL